MQTVHLDIIDEDLILLKKHMLSHLEMVDKKKTTIDKVDKMDTNTLNSFTLQYHLNRLVENFRILDQLDSSYPNKDLMPI